MNRPNYIPDDWINYAEVLPYSNERGGYPVRRVAGDCHLATFVQESDAHLFEQLKNKQLLEEGSI